MRRSAILLLALGALGGAAYLASRNRTSRISTERTVRENVAPPTGISEKAHIEDTTKRDGGIASSRDYRSEFQKGDTWRSREKIVLDLPRQDLDSHRDFLFSILEGTDVDAVRVAALKRLEELALNSDTAGWLAQRLVDRLPAEPRSGLRSWQLLVLGHLYLSRHRKEVEWVFDPILRALQADADPDVRSNAAVVLGDFARHELDRTVQALKSCLETEKDPGVRAAIERRLSQIQD